MNRRVLVTGLVLLVATVASPAAAQPTAPDLRSIPPAVMLLVDTSGSMERLPGCVCTTAGCDECLPACTSSGTSTRNRWAVTLEALTGSWSSFTCQAFDRRTPAFDGQYDENYYLPFHDPRLGGAQGIDGILDVYRTRAHFGLMTFDGIGTLLNGDPLVPATVFGVDPFQTTQRGPTGMWSYGDNKPFSFPGCATTYMINNGSRGAGATEGGLVSVGADNSLTDFNAINQLIQDRLVATRPFGGTPIAGMLDDVRVYFNTNNDVSSTGDPYDSCRERYVVLVTDGYPDSDFRDARFNCETPGYTCPYNRAEAISGDLCRWDAGRLKCTGRVNGVYVIGFDIADPQAIARLNDIANTGGTCDPISGRCALFANDRLSLLASLSAVLDRAARDVTTRTAPTFASSAGVAAGVQTQFQFQTGFLAGNMGTDPTVARTPWSGTLERVRIECSGLVPTQRAVDDTDRFHVILNNRNLGSNPRNLLTVVPGSRATAGRTIIGDYAGVSFEPFSLGNTRVSNTILGVGSPASRDAVINYVHGVSPPERAARRLGDIYHSTPVSIGPPTNDLADESYNLYRLRPEVANRPVMVYTGTNDGVLHAFAAENHNILAGPHAGTNLTAGTELWGFVPPVLLPALETAAASHQFMVDGTPVVREVLFSRSPGTAPDASRYHTVLITGLRGGADAFEALDVTDPLAPKFLWQFGEPDLGPTYGRPAIGVAYFEFDGLLQERAIAVLPGGMGAIDVTSPFCLPPPAADPAVLGTGGLRTRRRCWDMREGRQLYIVDVQTGRLLKHFDHTLIGSPMTGAPSLYTGDTGTTATRGFVTDADGIIWRIDLSSRDPNAWGFTPFYDMFWDVGPIEGQPAFEPPLLSVDRRGNVVVIQASGDGDRLDGLARNRVVSLTENVSFSSGGAFTGFTTSLNWDIHLAPGEQVTGPLELFDSKVYFGTFQSTPSSTDACAYGESFLWGVHYVDDDGASPPMPLGALEYPAGSGLLVQHTPVGDFANSLIMGVAVTQRPRCYDGVSTTDPYFGGTRYQVTNTGGGQFELVAQVSGTATRSTGAAVGTFTQTLPVPAAFTRLQSFGSSVE